MTRMKKNTPKTRLNDHPCVNCSEKAKFGLVKCLECDKNDNYLTDLNHWEDRCKRKKSKLRTKVKSHD